MTDIEKAMEERKEKRATLRQFKIHELEGMAMELMEEAVEILKEDGMTIRELLEYGFGKITYNNGEDDECDGWEEDHFTEEELDTIVVLDFIEDCYYRGYTTEIYVVKK